jgi:two-component system alkaline phosphatase synthesis response regulator PhoP
MATILSIDDDSGLQDLVSLVLGGHGHEVHWAFTGEEGYEKAQKLNPHLIILDMMLPTLNGVEVLKMLKAHEALRAIPVIVVTALVGEDPYSEKAVKALGAREFLQKPVKYEILAELVGAALLGAPPSPPAA